MLSDTLTNNRCTSLGFNYEGATGDSLNVLKYQLENAVA